MTLARRDALAEAASAGVWASLPTQLMVAPFGVLSGAISAEIGLGLFETLVFSVIVFAGASQIAILELLRDGAPWIVVVATGLAVNLRFAMYSAALAPWFSGASQRWLVPIGYLNTDNTFAIALTRYADRPDDTLAARAAFFLASGVLTWLVWQAGNVLGFFAGATLAEGLSLEIVTPVALLALVAPALRDRASWAAAIAGAATSLALVATPLNLGLLIAGAVGVAVGWALSRPLDAEASDD